MYHTTTWLLWLSAALLPTMLTKSPFYLVILLLAVAVLYSTIGRSSPQAASWSMFLRVGLSLAVFAIVINPLTVHYGDTVLLTLPRLSLGPPGMAPLELGGRITLEALSYSLVNGLSLIAVLLIFATFNVLVDHHQLLRAVPSFLYQTGMVISIAIAFVPQMMASLREIREAQTIRGHRFRGIRDLLPLFMPLLTSGLERAIQLAESMEARGFGGDIPHSHRGQSVACKASIALSLFGLPAGLFLYGYFPAARWVGGLVATGSLLLFAWALRTLGRRVRRSRYRVELWRRRDTLVSTASLLSVAVFLLFWWLDRGSLMFYPYPRFALPTFNPLIGLASLVPAVPVLTAPSPSGRRRGP
jgi:energy-coupling factor transport system permease protein